MSVGVIVCVVDPGGVLITDPISVRSLSGRLQVREGLVAAAVRPRIQMNY